MSDRIFYAFGAVLMLVSYRIMKWNTRPKPAKRPSERMLLDQAFRVDFERNGPSLFRLMQTMMRRWQRYRSDADPRVRARVKVALRSFAQAMAPRSGPWSDISWRKTLR
jgi:hypothetical protein